mmetsp:Transcript_3516/g.5220  ORF Transcript_3516/g.5220 Transcript_3516/m.5220 type:complete len:513 (-) Transcript_3516:107-1645(-)
MRIKTQSLCLALLLLSFFVTTTHGTAISDNTRILANSTDNQDAIDNNQTRELEESTKSPQPTWYKVSTVVIVIVQGLIGIYGALFVSALLLKKTVRKVSYNAYLIFLVVPDTMVNIFFFAAGVARLCGSKELLFINGLQWVLVFYYVGNFWMNCIVAYEMFTLVKKSYQREKTNPPSLRKVLSQGSFVYTIALLIAIWYALEVPWSPYSVTKQGTAVWASMEGGVFSTKGTILLTTGITVPPTVYVLYIAFTIWWKKLLPKSGRTRVISLYFIRILMVFFVFYYPGIAIYILKTFVKNQDIFLFMRLSNRVIEFTQALLTLHLSRKKADVNQAVEELRSNIVAFFKNCLVKPFSTSTEQIGDITVDPKNLEGGLHEDVKPPMPVIDKNWEEDNVYDDPLRKPESVQGSQIEKVVWKDIEDEKVVGKDVPKSAKKFILSDFESSEDVSLNRSSKASAINNRSEFTMDSYDSDFRRLNDGMKRLDLEADEIYLKYLKDSSTEKKQNNADDELSA